MGGIIENVFALADDKLKDAYVNLRNPNFKDWPDKPTGVAGKSERDKTHGLDLKSACMPEVVVYEHIDFGGAEWRTNLSYSWVGSWWNDRISSIIVVCGVWRFYEHKDFQGRYWDLGPGYYHWVVDAGIPNDIISSFLNIGA